MIPKKAIQTIVYSFSAGLTALLVAKFSEGSYIDKVQPLVYALMLAGLTSSVSIVLKGKQIDQECDERENFINKKAMKFTFYIMSLVLIGFWAKEISATGSYSNNISYLLYAHWGSFILSYGFNKLRT